MRRIAAACLFAMLAAAVLSAQQPAGPSAASPSLTGTWIVISAERQMEPHPGIVGATVMFGDSSFRIERTEERAPWYGDLRVDYRTQQIDMVHLYKGFMLPTYGTLWEGIFRFEGDTLVIAHAEGHDARPTEFMTGYDLTMMRLERKTTAVPPSVAEAAKVESPVRAPAPADRWAPTPQRLLYTVARSLGMLRGVQENDLLYTVVYDGTGTSSDVASGGTAGSVSKVTKFQVEIDYRVQGMRVDVTRTNPAGAHERHIGVVVGKAAWDEAGITIDGPPMGPSQTGAPATVAERVVQLSMTPFGAVKAARAVADKVTARPLGPGEYELTFPHLGATWKMALDRNRRPARIETTVNHPVLGNNVPLITVYSGYKDYQLSDIFFPSRIVQTLGGRQILDFQINRCRCINPYVIFPVPDGLAAGAR